MKFISLMVAVFRRLIQDMLDFIGQAYDLFLRHFSFLSLWDKLFLISTFLLFLSFIFPVVSYSIFGEKYYIRHSQIFLSPFLILSAFVGCWWENKYSLYWKGFSVFLTLIMLVYILVPSLMISPTILEYSRFIGFYLILVVSLIQIVFFIINTIQNLANR